MTGKYGHRSAWDWAVALLPMLGWLRTYDIKGYLVVCLYPSMRHNSPCLDPATTTLSLPHCQLLAGANVQI